MIVRFQFNKDGEIIEIEHKFEPYDSFELKDIHDEMMLSAYMKKDILLIRVYNDD